MAVSVVTFEKNLPQPDLGANKIAVLVTAIKILVSIVKNVKYRMITSGIEACLLIIIR